MFRIKRARVLGQRKTESESNAANGKEVAATEEMSAPRGRRIRSTIRAMCIANSIKINYCIYTFTPINT